jgi:hypothetical protein
MLKASPGTWRGTRPFRYTYRWQRCNSARLRCTSIAGANGKTYLLVSRDVGSRIRVSVIASNVAGSATRSSAPTRVVREQTTPTSNPFYVERLDGRFTRPFWYESGTSGGGSTSWVPGYSGRARRITLPGVSSAGPTYGQSLSFVTTKAHVAYAGSGSCDFSCNGVAQDSWYRFKLRLPTDYKPTPGAQNTLFEFHVDPKTETDASNQGSSAYSTVIGVQSDGGCSGSPAFCRSYGTNPRLWLQTAGGSSYIYGNAHNYVHRFAMRSNSLRLDHWYDIVLHVYWSGDPEVGQVQWWVDGVKRVDVRAATLYTRTDRTWSYGSAMGFYDYRLWANWAASVDFDELSVGPSANSLGFAPS